MRDEIGHRASRLDACARGSPRSGWRRDETSTDEVVQRVLTVDGRQTGDRPAPSRDEHLSALLDAIKVLAEPVVKLPDANLIVQLM